MASIYYTVMGPILSQVATANADSQYGPYDSLSAALTAVESPTRAIGKTVGIMVNGSVVEYWFKSGITDSDLVVKSTSGSSSGGAINIVTTSTETITWLNAQYPSAAIGDRVINTTTGAIYLKYSSTGWVKTAGTILTDTAPTVAEVSSASVLSYK